MSITCCTEFTKPMTSRPPKTYIRVGFGPPNISDAPIGTIYIDKDTNNACMLTSEKKWIHMINYGEQISTAAKDNKNITNCRNCGAPVRTHQCEYCGTRY